MKRTARAQCSFAMCFFNKYLLSISYESGTVIFVKDKESPRHKNEMVSIFKKLEIGVVSIKRAVCANYQGSPMGGKFHPQFSLGNL